MPLGVGGTGSPPVPVGNLMPTLGVTPSSSDLYSSVIVGFSWVPTDSVLSDKDGEL